MQIIKSTVAGLLAAGAISGPAGAVDIVVHGGAPAGSPADQGLQAAVRYWESVLTNNATVELNVGFSGLQGGVLAATSNTVQAFVPVRDYFDALAATQVSSLDASVVSHLPPLNATGNLSVIVPGYVSPGLGIDAGAQRVAPTGAGDAISNTIGLTTANAKAFGAAFAPGTIDADIRFSSTATFDFNPGDGIDAGARDFVGIAIHEIGHALGFFSGADDFDFFDGDEGPVDNTWWGYGLDAFRYSAPGQLNWTPGVRTYFSIDGGATPFLDGFFSTGAFNGDGNQASHWREPNQATRCLNFRGIMNPYVCTGTGDFVSGLDLAAIDAIGWNLSVGDLAHYQVSTRDIFRQSLSMVPEPATWASMLLGFGFAGAALRRARRALSIRNT